MSIIEQRKALIIVDYNLSRVNDVKTIRDYAARQHNLLTVLVRPNPLKHDFDIADYVIDADPLVSEFVERARAQLVELPCSLVAGLVFSDNAIVQGARLLESLQLPCDSSELAVNAFCKYRYRETENTLKPLLNAQSIFVPAVAEIHNRKTLKSFVDAHGNGVVIKPKAEGNNRGVILLRNPSVAEIDSALEEVAPYMASGVIVEECIPYLDEYSYDGIGGQYFLTEKFSTKGRYPVEFGQLVPAVVSQDRHQAIVRAGRAANLLVGQNHGAFHNEILVAEDNSKAGIVEPNRRPAGMKIWSLASRVFDQNLYEQWVDSALGYVNSEGMLATNAGAMMVMLPAPRDMYRTELREDIGFYVELLHQQFAQQFPQYSNTIIWSDYEPVAPPMQRIYSPPRDNGDFLASVVLTSSDGAQVLKDVFAAIQDMWRATIDQQLFDESIKSA